MLILTTLFSIHTLQLEFIETRVLDPARHSTLILPLVGLLLTTLDLHIQVLELKS